MALLTKWLNVTMPFPVLPCVWYKHKRTPNLYGFLLLILSLLTALYTSDLTSVLQVKCTSFAVSLLTAAVTLFLILRISSHVWAEYRQLLNTGQTQQLMCSKILLCHEKKRKIFRLRYAQYSCEWGNWLLTKLSTIQSSCQLYFAIHHWAPFKCWFGSQLVWISKETIPCNIWTNHPFCGVNEN